MLVAMAVASSCIEALVLASAVMLAASAVCDARPASDELSACRAAVTLVKLAETPPSA